jgi:hypothetical protein
MRGDQGKKMVIRFLTYRVLAELSDKVLSAGKGKRRLESELYKSDLESLEDLAESVEIAVMSRQVENNAAGMMDDQTGDVY